MTKSFYEYMRDEHLRDCPGADLYEDMKRDKTFPKEARRLNDIRKYLEREHACREAMDTFEEWWLTYAHDEDLTENMMLLDCARLLQEVLDNYAEDIDIDAFEEIQKIVDYMEGAA